MTAQTSISAEVQRERRHRSGLSRHAAARVAAFVEEVVDEVRRAPVDVTQLQAGGVAGSLLQGAAGVAFFLTEASRLCGGDPCGEGAQRWYDLAEAWARGARTEDWGGSASGVFLGEAGLAYVDATIGVARRDPVRVSTAVRTMDRVTRRAHEVSDGFRPTDLFGGAAGVVCTTRDLLARLAGAADHARARQTLARIHRRALARVLGARETSADGAPPNVGIGHGLAGELFVLVSAVGVEGVGDRIERLIALRKRDRKGRTYWLSPRQSLATLGSWCNGMPGHAMLWMEVARQTRASRFAELARGAIETTAHLPSGGAGLCCGMPGAALVLLRHADLTGVPADEARAEELLLRTMAADRQHPGRGLAFWQGSLGLALVGMMRLSGEHRLPCIEPFGFDPAEPERGDAS